jgi:phosphotriesterase-related protein
MAEINRRRFLQLSAALGAAGMTWEGSGVVDEAEAAEGAPAATPGEPQIMTVLGPIAPSELGVTLPHEHVLVDFIGAKQVSPDRYDANEAFEVVLPHLKRVKELGCDALVDC